MRCLPVAPALERGSRRGPDYAGLLIALAHWWHTGGALHALEPTRAGAWLAAVRAVAAPPNDFPGGLASGYTLSRARATRCSAWARTLLLDFPILPGAVTPAIAVLPVI